MRLKLISNRKIRTQVIDVCSKCFNAREFRFSLRTRIDLCTHLRKRPKENTVTNMHQSRRTGNDESLSNENDLEERNGRHHFDAIVNQTYGN